LFSIYNSPGTSSARRSPSPILSPNERRRSQLSPIDPTVVPVEARPISIKKPALGKRKKSEISPTSSHTAAVKQKTDDEANVETTEDPTESSTNVTAETNQAGGSLSSRSTAEQATTIPDETTIIDDPNLIQDLQEEEIRDLIDVDDDSGWETDSSEALRVQERLMDEALAARGLPPNPLEWFDPSEEAERYAAGILDDDDDDDDMYDDIDDDEYDEEFEDGGAFDFEAFEDEYGEIDDELHDYDEDYEDEDDYDEENEDDEDGPGLAYPEQRSADTEFGNVDMITPRRMFKGARNVETVKDCTLSPSLPNRV
jgi:hypothetical protein